MRLYAGFDPHAKSNYWEWWVERVQNGSKKMKNHRRIMIGESPLRSRPDRIGEDKISLFSQEASQQEYPVILGAS
jgi:hypothetical protein